MIECLNCTEDDIRLAIVSRAPPQRGEIVSGGLTRLVNGPVVNVGRRVRWQSMSSSIILKERGDGGLCPLSTAKSAQLTTATAALRVSLGLGTLLTTMCTHPNLNGYDCSPPNGNTVCPLSDLSYLLASNIDPERLCTSYTPRHRNPSGKSPDVMRIYPTAWLSFTLKNKSILKAGTLIPSGPWEHTPSSRESEIQTSPGNLREGRLAD